MSKRRKRKPDGLHMSVEVRWCPRRLAQLKRVAKAFGYDVSSPGAWVPELLKAGSEELYHCWWEMEQKVKQMEQKVKQRLAKPVKPPKPRPIDLLLARLKDPATREATAHDMLVFMGVRKPVLKLVKAA